MKWAYAAVAMVASVCLVAAADGCDVENHVWLSVERDEAGVPSGFWCDPYDSWLKDRVTLADAASLVVEFITAEGYSECGLADFKQTCAEGRCNVVESTCFDLILDLDASPSVREALSEALLRVLEGGGVVSPDAPDEPVVIRIVARAVSCEEDCAPCELLLGCALSCPWPLDELEDEGIRLSLDPAGSLEDQCNLSLVQHCARLPAGALCPPDVGTDPCE